MKFAMLYSCGKDSALALHRMISEGHEPVCLITTFNEDAGRSWFHGVTPELLESVSIRTNIPLITCSCSGSTYQTSLEGALRQAKEQGAEAAVFGDIDIEDHLNWNRDRCSAVDLECVMPLWQESRRALVHEAIDAGFKAVIKTVDLAALDESFLGKTLDRHVVAQIEERGVDVCGENGEYHTFVYDGPLFLEPLPIALGEKLCLGTHSVIDITLDR